MRVLRILLLVLAIVEFIFPSLASAQTNGVSVTPSITRLDLSQDKPEIVFYYKNNTNNLIELSFSAQDFTELEEGWKVKFLDEKSSQNYQYSLTSWIEFERKSLTLKPSEEGQLRVLVNKDELSPGGHYATILAEIVQLNQQGGQVRIKGLLSSILFVRANTGKEIESGKISSFETIQNYLGFPKQFLVRFQNTGNVELIPYGIVEIKDPFDNLVVKGILNEGSLITLPESIKRYDIIFSEKPTLFLLPGFYSAELTLKYGKDEKIVKAQNSFFYLGGISLATVFILPLFVGLAMSRLRKKIKSTGM